MSNALPLVYLDARRFSPLGPVGIFCAFLSPRLSALNQREPRLRADRSKFVIFDLFVLRHRYSDGRRSSRTIPQTHWRNRTYASAIALTLSPRHFRSSLPSRLWTDGHRGAGVNPLNFPTETLPNWGNACARKRSLILASPLNQGYLGGRWIGGDDTPPWSDC